jgi:hypothetical protein
MKSFVALALAAFVSFVKAGVDDLPTIDVNDFQ